MAGKHWLTDEEYRFIYDRVPRLCVDLLILTPKGFLLALRDIPPHRNTWHLPGGRVQLGETVEKAAKRIARTETGLRIRLTETLGYVDFPNERQFGRRIHSTSIVLLAVPAGKAAKTGSRTKAFRAQPARMHSAHNRFLKAVGAWNIFKK